MILFFKQSRSMNWHYAATGRTVFLTFDIDVFMFTNLDTGSFIDLNPSGACVAEKQQVTKNSQKVKTSRLKS